MLLGILLFSRILPGLMAQQVLVSQPAGPLNGFSIWTSNYGSNAPASDYNYRIFENFTAAKDSQVTRIRWTGTIHDLINRSNNLPKLTGNESWRVVVLSDQEGLPAALLLDWNVPLSATPSSLLHSTTFSFNRVQYPIEVREWSTELPVPLSLQADRNYWISIQLRTGPTVPLFSWYYSRNGGDGYYQYYHRDRSMNVRAYDLAFTLEGTLGSGGSELPKLRILPVGASVTLSWLDSGNAFQLESTRTLGPAAPVWGAVPGAPVSAQGQRSITVPRNSGVPAEFFRLRPAR